MNFACVYIPNFAAEALMRADATLVRERPLAVMDGSPPLVRVVAANEAARLEGIEPGMTKLEAAALDSLQMRQRSPAQEAATHGALLDCACAFSPKVEATARDTVVMEIAGLERIFGPPARLGRALAERVAALGVECSVAIAPNIEAAMHAARGFRAQGRPHAPLRRAPGSPGFAVTVIAPGEEARRLGELPIHVLLQEPLALDPGLWGGAEAQKKKSKHPDAVSANGRRPATSGEMLETLDRWGVRTFRAFALLPPIALGERLGQMGVALQKLARGEGLRSLNAAEPPLVFAETLELEDPVETLEPLAFLLNRMLEQLCARLEARALATNELRLRLELEDNSDKIIEKPGHGQIGNLSDAAHAAGEGSDRGRDNSTAKSLSCSIRLQLPVAIRDAKVFLKLLQLELAAHPPTAPVVKVFLQAEPAGAQHAQHGLFTPQEPQPERLELMLARIAGIVGRGRAGAAQLEDSYRPDGFRMAHFQANLPRAGSAARTRRGGANAGGQEAKPNVQKLPGGEARAGGAMVGARIFRPPRAAAVEMVKGVPGRVACTGEQGPRGAVTWAAGPWRSSGEWWNATSDERAAWKREEWDVEIAGGLYRLAMSENRQWAIEGGYD